LLYRLLRGGVDRLVAVRAEQLELFLERLGRLQTLAHETPHAIRAASLRAGRRPGTRRPADRTIRRAGGRTAVQLACARQANRTAVPGRRWPTRSPDRRTTRT